MTEPNWAFSKPGDYIAGTVIAVNGNVISIRTDDGKGITLGGHKVNDARRDHITEMLAAKLMDAPPLAVVPTDADFIVLAKHLAPLVERIIDARVRIALKAHEGGYAG